MIYQGYTVHTLHTLHTHKPTSPDKPGHTPASSPYSKAGRMLDRIPDFTSDRMSDKARQNAR